VSFAENLELASEEFPAQLEPDQQLSWLLEQGKQAGRIPPDITLVQLRRALRTEQIIVQATHGYTPPCTYPGSIILLRASEVPAEGIAQDLGWQAVASRVEIVWTQGSHMTMLEQPHVESLAEQLQRYLDIAVEEVYEEADSL